MRFLDLFAGIGGFSGGFESAGMECAGHVEIDADCHKILRRHSPAPIHNDICSLSVGDLGGQTIDLISGGFPCQDVSVAGKRKGVVGGKRSGLWFEFHRLITETWPDWVVIENVPGLLSSNKGCDFALVLGGLTGLVPGVPPGGWGTAGLARGPFYKVAWRVFDAQYFGVAQRRRRVFIVGHLGDGRAAEVLFEPESLSWDTAPSRKTGKGVAALTANGVGTCGADDNQAQAGHLVAFGGGNTSGDIGVSTCLTHHGARQDFDTETFVVTPAHPIAPPLTSNRYSDHVSREGLLVAFSCKDSGGDCGEISPTLRAMPHDKSHENGGGQGAITFAHNQDWSIHEECSPSITNSHGGTPAVAFTERSRSKGRTFESQEELAYALTNPGSGGSPRSRKIAGSFGVRRLTPTECERLQAFPDHYTLKGESSSGDPVSLSDSARYRMLGNAVNRKVSLWLGKRILLAHHGLDPNEGDYAILTE